MGGDGGCRVGEVQAGTTSPMPDHKGFKLQELVNFQKFRTLRVKYKYVNIRQMLQVGQRREAREQLGR